VKIAAAAAGALNRPLDDPADAQVVRLRRPRAAPAGAGRRCAGRGGPSTALADHADLLLAGLVLVTVLAIDPGQLVAVRARWRTV
jgi:hypothetical protein